jgi:hypothetical protein
LLLQGMEGCRLVILLVTLLAVASLTSSRTTCVQRMRPASSKQVKPWLRDDLMVKAG